MNLFNAVFLNDCKMKIKNTCVIITLFYLILDDEIQLKHIIQYNNNNVRLYYVRFNKN